MQNQVARAADFNTVAAIQLFETVPDDQAPSIADNLRLCHIDSGDEVLGPDANERSVCFVLHGAIRVSHTARTGREVILVERGSGEFVGLFEQTGSSNASFRIVATQPTCVAFMRCSELTQIVLQHPKVLERLLSHGLDFTHHLSERLVELATLKVRHRIYVELLRLAGGEDGQANTLALSPAPRHSELASRVCTHREAVTRELGRLEKAGVIQRIDGSLLIHDADYLRKEVQEAR